MRRHIFCYTLFLVGFLFLAGAGVAGAVSLPTFSETSDLPGFISSIYSFALTIVGLAVFVRVLWAGFLWLTAAGNASKAGEARDMMKNAVIGAIFLFSAYLILYVINPDLVKNTFNFTIPGSSSGLRAVPTEPSVRTPPTAGPVAVAGMAGEAGGAGIMDSKAVSFVPAAQAQEGVYFFTLKVTDRDGNVCKETYSMEVLPNVAAVSAGLYAENSIPGWRPFASSVNTAAIFGGAKTAYAQEESDAEQIIRSGGCFINTRTVPDAIAGVPYYAEIYVAGQAPYTYEIEDGSLPRGLNIVAVLDMPTLTIKNITAQRTPPTAFKVGETFRLELTNGRPNSAIYFKWFKDGRQWFYPGLTPTSAGWTKYGSEKTDANGEWVNEAAFTTNEIGFWQEYVMVDGRISKVLEFQVLAPEVKITVTAPTTGTPAYGGYSGAAACTVTTYCENRETGETYPRNENPEYISGYGWTNCEGKDRMISECVYPGESRGNCAQYDFEARNCQEQISSLEREGGSLDISGLFHSADGNPPTDVSAGSLYTTDQYSGDIRLGAENFLVRCRYSDQVAAVSCGATSSGEYCLPDGRNAGWNETWCAGKIDSSGKIINPTPAPTPIP